MRKILTKLIVSPGIHLTEVHSFIMFHLCQKSLQDTSADAAEATAGMTLVGGLTSGIGAGMGWLKWLNPWTMHVDHSQYKWHHLKIETWIFWMYSRVFTLPILTFTQWLPLFFWMWFLVVLKEFAYWQDSHTEDIKVRWDTETLLCSPHVVVEILGKLSHFLRIEDAIHCQFIYVYIYNMIFCIIMSDWCVWCSFQHE